MNSTLDQDKRHAIFGARTKFNYQYRILIGIIILVGVSGNAASSQDDFHKQVAATYDFSPHKISHDQRVAKSSELDKIWSTVNADPPVYLPLLRVELQDSTCPKFFAYDGSKLLLSLSKDRSDMAIAAHAMGFCDIRDVDPAEYLKSVNWLANEGMDVRGAAFNILDEPAFKAFYPIHALTLGQEFAFVLAIFPMADSLFLDSCLSRLGSSTNDSTTMTLLNALWFTTTQRGFDAIATIGGDQTKSAQVRDYAQMMVTELAHLKDSLGGLESAGDYEALKAKRQLSLQGVSDENLYEFVSQTEQIQIAFFRRK
ncbi:MAG: hypothetical protein WAU88_06520 [Candidatus Zixiibacteriota bacterium]